MRKTAIVAVTGGLALLVAVGCSLPASPGPVAPSADSWTTYTSPDGRVQFDHPASLQFIVRPRQQADDPQLALTASAPDESIQLTLLMRVSDDLDSEYCKQMMSNLVNGNTRAISERQNITVGNARGIRQEFREEIRGQPPVELIAVALEARPAYVHFTCGYPASNKAALRPVCERIVESLTLKK
jgi:hypothetical protein